METWLEHLEALKDITMIQYHANLTLALILVQFLVTQVRDGVDVNYY